MFIKLITTMSVVFLLVGCATGNKNTKSDPQLAEKITEMKTNMSSYEAEGLSLLAPETFEDLKENQEELTEAYKDGKLFSSVSELVSEREALKKKFKERSSFSEKYMKEIIEARSKAIERGGDKNLIFEAAEEETRDLAEEVIDRDVNETFEHNQKIVNMFEVARVKGIQSEYLRVAISDLNKAEKSDGYEYFETEMNSAKDAIENAKSLIAEYPDRPQLFSDSVSTAGMTAAEVYSLVQTAKWADTKDAKQISKRLHEETNTVLQNFTFTNPRIFTLDSKLAMIKNEAEYVPFLAAELTATQIENSARKHKLEKANKNVKGLQSKLESQKKSREKLEQVRSMFNKGEAEVFVQGDDIIVSLVGLNFAFNKAELPQDANTILKKVGKATTMLSPEEIRIVGHSDSVGDALYNQKLSMKRAQTVDSFLNSDLGIDDSKTSIIGLGFQRPYSDNKTVEGREKNRRIDIVFESVM